MFLQVALSTDRRRGCCCLYCTHQMADFVIDSFLKMQCAVDPSLRSLENPWCPRCTSLERVRDKDNYGVMAERCSKLVRWSVPGRWSPLGGAVAGSVVRKSICIVCLEWYLMLCFPGRHLCIPFTLSEVVGCKEDRLAIPRVAGNLRLKWGTLGVPQGS
jgi:hypothetical protein